MLRCVAGRLRGPALEQTLGLHKANRARCVTLTLHKGQPFECSGRSVCGGVSTPAHLRKRLPETHGCAAADWRRLEPVLDSEGGRLDLIWPWRRRHGLLGGRAEAPGYVTFTGIRGVSINRTLHVRASSTAAAPRRSDDREEVPAKATDMTEEQNPKGSSPSPSSTSSSQEKSPESPEPEGGKLSKTQQLKKVFKEYGAVGVSFHVAISLMSLGMFYLLVSSGIDMAALLCKLGFSEAVVQSRLAAGTSTFVLAYAVHKLFAPVRISITLVSVPLIVRYFRKTGLFKPPPTPP